MSTTKTVIVTSEKTSTLSATIIQEKITHQTTISIDMVSNKTEKNTTQTKTPFYAFKSTADKAKTQTAQDNKTTQSIRQTGTTTDTDKIEDKQTTTEIIYMNNSQTKQATTQLSSTVNDMSVTFGDTKAHTATSSDPNTFKAVQTTTQAATTKSTTDASITSSNNIVYVSAKEQHLFTTIIKVTSPVEQTATNSSSTDEAVTTTSDASKLPTEQSTNHATTSSSGIIATTTKLTTKQTPKSRLITTKGDTTTSNMNGAATTIMETLYDSKRFTSKQDIKQTMSSNDSNNTTTNNTTKSNQGATQTSTRMFTVAPFESTTDKVLLTDNSSVECISMENRTLSASEIITSTMKQSDFEAEAKSTAKLDREQITTDTTEHKSTITFEAKSSERSTLQGYPTATREDVTLAFDSPVTSFITTKTNDVSTYSSTTEYQQEIASAEITKNELQSISTVMTTTEDVSSSIGHSAKTQSQNLHSTEKTISISTESTTSKTISSKDQDATTQTKTTSAPERTSFETNQESTITAEQSNTMITSPKAKIDITSALIQATFSTISDEQYGRSFLNQTSTSDRQSITPSLFQTTIRTKSKSDTPIPDKQSITSETVTNNNNTSDTQTHTTVSIDQTSDGTSSLQPDSSPRFTKARETTIFKSLSNSFTTRDPTSDSSTSDKQSHSTQSFDITSSLQLDSTTTMSEAGDTMTTLIQSGRSTTIGQMSIGTSSSVENSSAPLMIKTSDRTMLQTQYYSKSTKIQTEGTTAILQRSQSTPSEVTSTGSPSETQTSYSNPSNPSTEVSYTADSTTGNTQYMGTSMYSTPLEVQSQVSTKETQTTHHFDKSSTKSQSSDSITLSKTSDSTSSPTKYDNNSTIIHTEGTTALFQVRESTSPDIQSPVSTKETQTTNHFDYSSPKSQSSNAIFLGGTSGGTLSQTKYDTKSAMIQTEGTTSLLSISGRTSPKIQSKSYTTETQTIDSSSQKSQSSNAISIKTISKSTLPQTQFEGKSTIIQTEGTTTLFQISGSTPPDVTSAVSTLETRTSDSVSQEYQYSNAMTLNKISDSTLPQAQFDGISTINQTEGTTTLLQISGSTPSEVTSTVSTLETQTMNSNTSSEVYYTADSTTGKTQFMDTSISIDTTKHNTQANLTLRAVSLMETTYMYGNTISVKQLTDSTPTVDNTAVTQSNDSVLSKIYGKSTTILSASDNTAQSERITAIDHTTESFISNSQSNTHGNKREYTTTIRTLNYSSPSLASQFQETNRTPDIPLNYVTNVLQTSGRTKAEPELDITTVLNTGNKISVTKYAENSTETLTTENMTSATLSYRQNTPQTITQLPQNITDIQKNPLHRETTILNKPDTTSYSPDVTTEFLYSTTTQKSDPCNSFPCADGGICTSLSSTDSVCQCNSSKCGTCEYIFSFINYQSATR
ncbi:Hypothetical predicted protein [Mytilus galloprovincialis]|uniref:EGF-like domain-containing protein n=1 Tax=Mytilus galloprovincialis TaxID=29158 RepID=A0A8B6E235_MYTGA|nr:Hypothetical predicted protein [Mytilus galloprovincialis]